MKIQILGFTLTLLLCLASCSQSKTQDTHHEPTRDSIVESPADTLSIDSVGSKQAIDTLGDEAQSTYISPAIVCDFRIADDGSIPDSTASQVDTTRLDTILQDSTRLQSDSLSLDTRQYL